MTTRLRIATFNVESLDDEAGSHPSLAERARVLRPLLEHLQADILCLQEVNGQRDQRAEPRRLRALHRLLEGTRYADYQQASSLGSHPPSVCERHNVVTLSRLPLRAAHSIKHDLLPPPTWTMRTSTPPGGPVTLEWDRPVLHTVIALESARPLHVINLHLRAPLAAPIPGGKLSALAWRSTPSWAEGYHLAAMKALGQALEVRWLVDSLLDADPDALVVVAGDFNAEIREGPVRIIRADEEDTGNAALAGRMLTSVVETSGRRTHTVLHAGRALSLDHILVSAPMLLHLQHAEAINKALPDEIVAATLAGSTAASTHAPVVAEFTWPE